MTKKQKKILIRIIIAAVLWISVNLLTKLVVPALFLPGAARVITAVLFLVPYFVIGYDILKKALWGILHGEVFDENFLMAVATVGAIALGDFSEGVAVMLFYQIGELFQAVAVGKSRRNIAALMDIRPDYANIEGEDGQLEQVDPDDVEIGTLILVRPGEKVPIDGEVVEGTSALNTSALTGESVPREIGPGQTVLSGCINMSGLLKIRTTKEFGESTVSKILELVENSGMKKSKCENFITKFARYYTPVVCYSALALAVLPPLVNLLLQNPASWGTWITRALTFLVISCPCALVISIPLSFFAGIGAASANGILVKGSNYLEALAKTGYVVFDKTGTLTEGVFRVTKIETASGYEPEKLLEYAAYAESFSTHPISKSLLEGYGKMPDRAKVSHVEEVSGQGVLAMVDGVQVAAGNAKLMKKIGIWQESAANTVSQFMDERASLAQNAANAGEPAQNAIEHVDLAQNADGGRAEESKIDTEAGTVVYVALDGVYAGYILISDVEKATAAEAIRALKAAGVKKTVMLTGDSRAVAEQVATRLQIDGVYSELLPGDKVEKVEELLGEKRPGEMLAFVGDGINDAPVLSRADIGIAMGALGSDAAIEAADIVLMDDNPQRIALAMAIARKTLRIVYQNIVFALGVKGICLILGAWGKAGMWIAIFADVGVMVIAVLNAIRCLRVPKK